MPILKASKISAFEGVTLFVDTLLFLPKAFLYDHQALAPVDKGINKVILLFEINILIIRRR